MAKKMFMIAGPNGSGKTTTAMSLILETDSLYEFINADEIAKGLAPMHPESTALTASKLMLKRLRELVDNNKNFAFETTAAGTNYIKHLKEAQAKGYEVELLFLWLSSPELAIDRVAKRVAQGGHHIPEETIRNRYRNGIRNLIQHYLPISNYALIMDNSSFGSNTVIAKKDAQTGFTIEAPMIWKEIERMAHDTKK